MLKLQLRNTLMLEAKFQDHTKHEEKTDDIYTLPRYYAASNGNPSPTFRDNLSIPVARVKNLGLFSPNISHGGE
jgi:hypothetical protein